MDPSVIVVFGAPSSGKSTFCQNVRDLLRQNYGKIPVHVEFDYFANSAKANRASTLQAVENFDVVSWREGRQMALSYAASNLKDMKDNDKRNHILLIDDTFHLRSMRKEVYKLARQCKVFVISLMSMNTITIFSADSAKIHFVFVDASSEKCIVRNQIRRGAAKLEEIMAAGNSREEESNHLGIYSQLTDQIIEAHCRVLEKDCGLWRLEEFHQDFMSESSPLNLVAPKVLYKWERDENCFCWHLDANINRSKDLARKFVLGYFQVARHTQAATRCSWLATAPTKVNNFENQTNVRVRGSA